MIDNIPGNSFGENISMGDEANRVKTGIEGFDDICGGGMLRDRTYLVSGNSGAGKTNFAIQFIYNGIVKYNENGLIVATEEKPEHIRENVATFGWDLEALEDEGKLAIIDASSTKIGIPSQEKFVDVRPFDMRSMIDQIITAQEETNAKRALIDSSTALGFQIQDPPKIRVELLKLSATLEILGLTSMMTCETLYENEVSRFGVENFVTEGTIMLNYHRQDNVRSRSIEVYKMRGSDHSKKLHPYDITSEGIVIHPNEEVYML
ncbi:putative circadian clock protein, KaiC [Methanosalsum zhilinae DSM 4017]|uniref:Putative circadian clock protein, KaiC n=1 Tax=Methanosalsum zhilinae (strain DSM 4017 / NBRC 107636 / OCM 62 / WeN5) TaxID=679901 RepID=F7XNB2_METZD|nr:ATPase domain-containing protein [Methanosalsum zhilinae]AEH60072.1 putative circadian clock protein, KaiC [Methanosalsum zhilinae DSM 4017]